MSTGSHDDKLVLGSAFTQGVFAEEIEYLEGFFRTVVVPGVDEEGGDVESAVSLHEVFNLFTKSGKGPDGRHDTEAWQYLKPARCVFVNQRQLFGGCADTQRIKHNIPPGILKYDRLRFFADHT